MSERQEASPFDFLKGISNNDERKGDALSLAAIVAASILRLGKGGR